ncbi:segregation/condensation protein A [Candidatus Sumerlaeota bacterium]|nr:segregation/condensation protein A [Candidatus Sumerlaeota bacterium]
MAAETTPRPPDPLRVQTETFEGPFDLLLHLVRVHEMDIFDINIAEITDRYLEHLARMERHNLEIAGEFLVMASTLLNIKSRTLLPENPHVEDDEEEGEIAIQTTEDLVRQLIEYRRFKEIAQVLSEREVAQMRIFYRTHMPPRPREDGENEMPPQEIDTLLRAFARVVQLIEVDRRHEVLDEEAHVEDALAQLRDALQQEGRTRFSTLLHACRTKIQMIVMLMAVLEMVKAHEAHIEQAALYEDIHIIRRGEEPDDGETEPRGAQTERGSTHD